MAVFSAATSSIAIVQSLQGLQTEGHLHVSPSSSSFLLRRMSASSLAELRSATSNASRSFHGLFHHSLHVARKRGLFSAAAGAGDDDEVAGLLEPPKENGSGESLTDVATAIRESVTGVGELKQGLVDALYGTQRGLNASSDTRAEVIELITQLEAQNPTPAPTEALTLLNGKWILAYTSFSELFPLLATGNLPLVKVGEISQTIDSQALTVQNSVSFEGPLATTSFSTSASFEVRSPKRVQIKFEEGIIGTPQLTDSIEIPETMEFLGQSIDLTPIQGVLRPLQDAATSVARTLSGQPPFKFPIQANQAQSWLLTTFLDEELRISRGEGGSIFVLIREGSPLLS